MPRQSDWPQQAQPVGISSTARPQEGSCWPGVALPPCTPGRTRLSRGRRGSLSRAAYPLSPPLSRVAYVAEASRARPAHLADLAHLAIAHVACLASGGARGEHIAHTSHARARVARTGAPHAPRHSAREASSRTSAMRALSRTSPRASAARAAACTSTSSASEAITSCGLELLATLQIPKCSERDSNPGPPSQHPARVAPPARARETVGPRADSNPQLAVLLRHGIDHALTAVLSAQMAARWSAHGL